MPIFWKKNRKFSTKAFCHKHFIILKLERRRWGLLKEIQFLFSLASRIKFEFLHEKNSKNLSILGEQDTYLILDIIRVTL